jgi:ankyrin repeat protein
VDKGWYAIVKSLLDRHEINPNFIGEVRGLSALMVVSEPAVAKLLLDRENIDVNCQNIMGWTALSRAAHLHRDEVVKLLLEREDIKVNLPDKFESVPLYYACLSDCVSTVRLLLSHPDTDPNLVSIDDIRIRRPSNFHEIESLLAAHAAHAR